MSARRTVPAESPPMASHDMASRPADRAATLAARRHVLRVGLTMAFTVLAAGAAIGLGGAARAQGAEIQGEVTRIDKAGGRIGIRHGGIAHLDMPPMTMTFRVRDAQALDRLAVGDRVRFVADRVDGQFVITRIAKVG